MLLLELGQVTAQPSCGALHARSSGHACAFEGSGEQLAADLPLARAYFADVADASEIEDTFARIAVEQGTVDVLIYNAGKGVWGSAEGLFKNALEIR